MSIFPGRMSRKPINFLAASVAALSLAFAPAIAFASTSIAPNPTSLTHTFTSSGIDTVPSWATGAFITEQGGGAGGGVGYGGSSGEAWVDYFTPVTPGSTLTITVGAGGIGNAVGGNTSVSGAAVNVPVAYGGLSINGTFHQYYGIDGATMFGPATSSSATAPSVIPNYVPMQVQNTTGTIRCSLYDGSQLPMAGSYNAGACSRFGKGGAASSSGTGANATGYGAGGGDGPTAGGNGSPGLAIIRYVQ